MLPSNNTHEFELGSKSKSAAFDEEGNFSTKKTGYVSNFKPLQPKRSATDWIFDSFSSLSTDFIIIHSILGVIEFQYQFDRHPPSTSISGRTIRDTGSVISRSWCLRQWQNFCFVGDEGVQILRFQAMTTMEVLLRWNWKVFPRHCYRETTDYVVQEKDNFFYVTSRTFARFPRILVFNKNETYKI